MFCIHDADAAGSMIYQTLQGATAARAGRRIEIVNLGLEPWEAAAMGLAVENVKRDGVAPVADYVHRQSRADGTDWSGWLQTHRVELNEMNSRQLVTWLDEKMEAHGAKKLIPPEHVALEHAEAHLRDRIYRTVLDELKPEIDGRVEARRERIVLPEVGRLIEQIADAFGDDPSQSWRGVVSRAVDHLA